MSDNPGGNPPSDDEPVAPEPQQPAVPAEPAAAPPPPPPAPPAPPAAPPVAPPVPPVAPPAPQYGQPAPGAYPPPAPQYGQPAPGAYPPPAGYGQQAPGNYPPGSYPPPAGGYGAPPPSLIGEPFSYGWQQFTRNGGLFIGAGLVWFVILIVAFSIVGLIFGGIGEVFRTTSGGRIGFSLGFIVFSLIGYLVTYLVQAIFIRAALDLTEGRRLAFGNFFRFVDAGPVVITALLLTAISFVVGLVPLVGWLIGLVVNFLLFFTFWFVIGKQLAPVDAIKASYELITKNLSTTILFYLLALAILFAGALLCGVGLLVAVPVVLVATAFLFKRLLDDPIAPPV